MGACRAFGIVVVNGTLTNGNGSSYYAYDLACPKEWPTIVATFQTLQSSHATVPFVVLSLLGMGTGHPVEGASKTPLQQYRTTLTAGGVGRNSVSPVAWR